MEVQGPKLQQIVLEEGLEAADTPLDLVDLLSETLLDFLVDMVAMVDLEDTEVLAEDIVDPVLRVLRVLLGVVVVVVSGASLICLHVKYGSVSCFKYQEFLHFPCYKRDISVMVNENLKVCF